MPPFDSAAPAATAFISYRHLGFENFDGVVLAVIAGRLVVAALLAASIAYRPWRRFMHWHFDRTESGAQVLIAVAGALMVGVIGDNVALAFGLVGLGGFIRFRSGIKDPREAGVMFFMIGIGMACGIGKMPVALMACGCGIVLLTVLDIVDRHRRRDARRRIRFSQAKDPRQLEPKVRAMLEAHGAIRGSKVSVRREEITVDIYGDKISDAGMVYEMLSKAGVEFEGDVSCEEI